MKLYLSFDFEECDLPREAGVDFPIEEGMKVSVEGANAILDVLARHEVKATFFCTLNFAERAKDVMARIRDAGHEIAAHGVDHFHQTPEDPVLCKRGLESLCGIKVFGYRQPRMFPVDDSLLKKVGYKYNSSLNPAFIPGRYCHWDVSRVPFRQDGFLQVPASVTPFIRFPLFWLALHLLPEKVYWLLVKRTLAHDGKVVTYFHPWEFSKALAANAKRLKVPAIVKCNLGENMIGRLDRFIANMKKFGAQFDTIANIDLEIGL